MSFPHRNWDSKNSRVISIPITQFKTMIYMAIAIGGCTGSLLTFYLLK